MHRISALWTLINERLDRPWKRVGLMVWLPLVVATVAMGLYALLCVYVVYFSRDPDVWFCHRDLAGFANRPGAFNDQDMRAVGLAHQRMDARFSAETVAVENSPEFVACISKYENGSYWANYTYAWYTALQLLAYTVFFAIIIFPRFWRVLGSWIAGKPR
jgi:hypothetical protein